MAYTKKQGIRLRDGDLPGNREPGWLLRALFAWVGAVLPAVGAFSLAGLSWGYPQAVAAVACALYCALYAVLSRINRRQWFFVALPGALLLVTLLGGKWVLEGFCLVWNKLGDSWLLGTGWLLPRFQTRLPGSQSALCISLFAAVAAGLLTTLTCAVASLLPSAMGLLLSGSLLWAMAAFRLSGFSLTVPILTVAVLLVASTGWEGQKNRLPILATWAVCGLSAALLLAITLLPGLRGKAELLSQSVRREFHAQRYETGLTTLPEGDFANFTIREGSSRALTVTMDIPEAMYLRGYTGATFTDGVWEPLEKENLLKNRELLYWLNLNSFDPNCQFSKAAAQAGLLTNRVTVQNTGACSRYHYVPFGLYPGEFLEAENLNTQGVLADGERIYSYSAVAGGAEGIARVISYLQSSEDPDVLEYRRAESSYRSFVYSHYVHIPQEALSQLESQWEKTAREYGGGKTLTQEQKRECAMVFLSRCFPEDGTPEDMELPLAHLSGSAYQYATVAVLTLRYFGIPARYAEGYVITEQMAADAGADEAIRLDSSCASAWAEVYQDGVGWIPMDMTPGISEMIQHKPDDSLSSDRGQQENDQDPEKSEEDQPREEPSETPDPSGGSMVTILKKAAWWIVLPVLLLAAALLLLWLRRRKILERKYSAFRSEDVSAATGCIFADTAYFLELLGLDPGNGSVNTLVKPAEERFGERYAAAFSAAIACNYRALFSGRPLEEADREIVLRFREDTLGLVGTQLKWYRKIWLKWGRCLY